MVKVSLIIPTFNRPHLLPRAVESALRAGRDVEVIVVDDASSDRTASVCAAMGGIKYIRLDGQTKISERQELVTQFQHEESDVAVFLLSLKAGNAGLTLTKADYVCLFDPWWNTAVENQAIDRTHRIGQQSQVFAYRMICKDSIEEKIMKMAAGKKKLAEDLITAEEGFVKSLTLDDIKYLLE